MMPVGGAMDLYQIETFVAVAREGSITRAAGRLHLSQPAVSAHIKAMEEALGLSLFERTSRGMNLTRDGQRLLAKAEHALAAHRELLAEATRSAGELRGKLRLGAGGNSSAEAIGRLITQLSARHPGVEVVLEHDKSRELLDGIRSGRLDAGFYNEPGEPAADLATIDVARFAIQLVAAPGLLAPADRTDFQALARLPWIYPAASSCCGGSAEKLFAAHGFRPQRIISADRQDITRALVASGLGVGLLHGPSARAAEREGELDILAEAEPRVRVLFAHLASRAHDPILEVAASILRAQPDD